MAVVLASFSFDAAVPVGGGGDPRVRRFPLVGLQRLAGRRLRAARGSKQKKEEEKKRI